MWRERESFSAFGMCRVGTGSSRRQRDEKSINFNVPLVVLIMFKNR
jgi:hypothetical protein